MYITFSGNVWQKCDANQRKAKLSANFPILTSFDPIIMGVSSLNVKPLCYSAGPKHQHIVEDKREPEAEGPEDRGQEEDCPLHELPDKIDDILRVGCWVFYICKNSSVNPLTMSVQKVLGLIFSALLPLFF